MGKVKASSLLLACLCISASLPRNSSETSGLRTVYVHAHGTGKARTEVLVAGKEEASESETYFGAVIVIDHIVTETEKESSANVGRMQGIVSLVGQEEATEHIVATLSSPTGDSINVLGRRVISKKLNELVITGGTGSGRGTSGHVIVNTLQFDNATGNALFQYDIAISKP